MNEEPRTLSEQLYTVVLLPLLISSLKVTVATIFSAFIHKLIVKYYEKIMVLWHTTIFVTYASLYHYIFHSKLLGVFTITSCLIFEIIFLTSVKLSKEYYICTLKTATKCLISIYAIACFKILGNKEEVDHEFIITFIVMALKMLCVASEFEHLTLQNVDDHYSNAELGCLVGGYIAYPAWMTYDDFENLPCREPQRDTEWSLALGKKGLRAILFKILSHKLVPLESLGDFAHSRTVLLFIQAFQYRCKYYYLAQIGELETAATGLDTNNPEHKIFSFRNAETATTVKETLKALCQPLSSLLEDKSTFILNAVLLVSVTAYFDLYFASLLFLIVITILIQENAVTVLNNFFLWKYFLAAFNHFRMVLIFHKLADISYVFSMIGTLAAITFDILLSLTSMLQNRRHQVATLH